MTGIMDNMKNAKDMKDNMGSMSSSDKIKELEMKAKDNKLDEKGKAELERLRSTM